MNLKNTAKWTLCLASLVTGQAQAKSLRVGVASENPLKIAAVEQGLMQAFGVPVTVVGCKTKSTMPNQPTGPTAGYTGAHARIFYWEHNCQPEGGFDYVVAIESFVDTETDWSAYEGKAAYDQAVIVMKDLKKEITEYWPSARTYFDLRFLDEARQISSIDEDYGCSTTVGTILAGEFGLDPLDWHKDPRFGGKSRQSILTEAMVSGLHQNIFEFTDPYVERTPNFPKPGITFFDIFSVLRQPHLWNLSMNHLYERFKDEKIDAVVGLDARGFIIGQALASKLGVAFVPVRKQGKLPGPTIKYRYETEYSHDVFEMSSKSLASEQRVLIADDLLATGGTATAAIELVRKLGATVVGFVTFMELKDLGARAKLDVPVTSLLVY